MLARRHCECSSHRPLDPVLLFLLSQRHSTAAPSPSRYGNRYEVEWCANFGELRACELRRNLLPRTRVNKGMKKGRDSSSSCDGHATGAAYSISIVQGPSASTMNR